MCLCTAIKLNYYPISYGCRILDLPLSRSGFSMWVDAVSSWVLYIYEILLRWMQRERIKSDNNRRIFFVQEACQINNTVEPLSDCVHEFCITWVALLHCMIWKLFILCEIGKKSLKTFMRLLYVFRNVFEKLLLNNNQSCSSVYWRNLIIGYIIINFWLYTNFIRWFWNFQKVTIYETPSV